MCGSARGPVAVLLLALAVSLLLRLTTLPASQPDATSEGGSSGRPATCISQARCASCQRPTPNSTSAAPAAVGTAGKNFPGSTPGVRWHSRPTDDGLYIVRFRRYETASDHRAALQAALADAADVPVGSWEWIERRNLAAAYPTDFGLLRLAAPQQAAVKARLEQLPFVRDFHPERQITQALLAAVDPGAEPEAESTLSAALPGTRFVPCCSSDGKGDGPPDLACVAKRPGRLQTRPTFSLEDNQEGEEEKEELADGAVPAPIGNDTFTLAAGSWQRTQRHRRRLLQQGTLASILQADTLWEQGFRGQGVRMGVFDTGIKGDHPDVKHIVERSNWTHEPTLDDGLGHGSFVAGVIAGLDPACPGLAPEVSLYTFRVFTNDQVSYTSWFLDAFNYAMVSGMNVVNLSIGGPDFLDQPFVEKVAEITSSGIIMVSAIGNDGPLYGTLNNPADQNDVIGIGGIDYTDQIAPFSSRGMSTWEVPLGYGRSKPDVMAYGRDVQGSRIGGGCRSLSGTSVASPVVAGAVCLLASVVPEEKRWQVLNPASMKQALVEGAVRLEGLNLYEQGAGKLNVVNSKMILEQYKPRTSLVPAQLNFTDCPYMWPFCRQPIYATAMPLMFNATILSGLGLTGKLEAPPVWTPGDDGGRLLDVQFEFSEQLWPWSGYLALFIRVKPEGGDFLGTGSGEVEFTVVSPPGQGETAARHSTVKVPLTVAIVPTPPRRLRVLWDQFHSIRYPPAYFPRDDLQVRHDILDWHGDHPHTNYHDMFNALRDEGFFLEVLASPATCFNASHYGALLLVDGEDEYYPEEVAKLAADVEQLGMGLLVFADWYHLESIQRLRFYDDNTRSWWEAATGGANVPALNDLLLPYGVAFEQGALEVKVHIQGVQGAFHMASGVPIKALPAGAWLHRAQPKAEEGQATNSGAPVLALLQHGAGRLGLYGDSNCLDSSHSRSQCFKMLAKMLEWAGGKKVPALTPPEALLGNHYGDFEGLPQRRPDYNFTEASPVLQNALRCYPNSPLEFHGASFDRWKVPVSRPVRRPVAVQPDSTAAVTAGEGAAGQNVTQQQDPAAGAMGQDAIEQQQQQQQEEQQPGADQVVQQVQQAQQTAADQPAAAEALKEQATDAALAGIKKKEEALLKMKTHKEPGAMQQEQQGGSGGGDADATGGGEATAGGGGGTNTTTGDGRAHSDINGLAQFGDGLPQHVEEEVERDREPSDSGGGDVDSNSSGGSSKAADSTSSNSGSGSGAGFKGEGEATRSSSLLHKRVADQVVAGEAATTEKQGTFLHLSLVQAAVLCSLVALTLWSRSRRRQGPALRIQTRKWLLPLWWAGATGAAAQRDRHD